MENIPNKSPEDYQQITKLQKEMKDLKKQINAAAVYEKAQQEIESLKKVRIDLQLVIRLVKLYSKN